MVLYTGALVVGGVYHMIWRYAGGREMFRLMFLCAATTGVVLICNRVFAWRMPRSLFSLIGIFDFLCWWAARALAGRSAARPISPAAATGTQPRVDRRRGRGRRLRGARLSGGAAPLRRAGGFCGRQSRKARPARVRHPRAWRGGGHPRPGREKGHLRDHHRHPPHQGKPPQRDRLPCASPPSAACASSPTPAASRSGPWTGGRPSARSTPRTFSPATK